MNCKADVNGKRLKPDYAKIFRNAKSAERRVARAWGSDRWINDGTAHSDCNADCPVSLEVTRTKGGGIRKDKMEQCWANAAREGREPVLVIADYGDTVKQMKAVVNHGFLLWLAHEAGLITDKDEHDV